MKYWLPKPMDIGIQSVLGILLGISWALQTQEMVSYLMRWLQFVSAFGIVLHMGWRWYAMKQEEGQRGLSYLARLMGVLIIFGGIGYWHTNHSIDSYYEHRPFYYGTEGNYYVHITSSPQETVTVDGVMTMVDGTIEGLAVQKDGRTDHIPASGNVRMYVENQPDIHIGGRYVIEGAVKPFSYYEQSGALSMEGRHINDGLQGNLYNGHVRGTYEVERTWSTTFDDAMYRLWDRLDQVHHWVAKQFEENLDPSVATLGSSLVLGGQYALLPEKTVKLFSETGLIHILSVSGSHIALLFLIISTMVQQFSVSKRMEFSITCGIVLLYCTIVGWSPPVLRSAMMGLLSGYVVMHGGTYRALQALLLSALALLLWKPLYAIDISFILSFGSTLGIIGLQPYVYRLFPANPISKGISLCLSAQGLIFSIELYYFHILSFLSILSNLIVGPLLDFAIVGGLCLAVLNLLFTFGLGWSLLGFILKVSVSLLFAIRNLGLLWSPPMPMWLLYTWYVSLGYAYYLLAIAEPVRLNRNRWVSVAVLFLGMVPYALSYVRTEVKVIPIAISSGPAFMVCQTGFHREAYLYMDVKQGDLSPRSMKQCIDTLHHMGFSHWNGIYVEGYQKSYTQVKQLESTYSKGTASQSLDLDWLQVRYQQKSGYEVIAKGERVFHFHPRKEEKVSEIVYNTKRETDTIYGLTSADMLHTYQQRGASQFVVWNTLHTQFDVEEGVYIVGSDEDNVLTL